MFSTCFRPCRFALVKKRNTLISFLFVIVFFAACKNSPEEKKKSTGSVTETNRPTATTPADTVTNPPSITEEKKDTIVVNQSKKNEVLTVDGWKIDDFIVKDKDKSSEALRRTIAYTREEWQYIKNPLIATYRGCDFGDYFHLNFEDKKGKNHDFGWGNNDYGKYLLFSLPDYIDNPAYLGKSFRIYWAWKVSSFSCCDGEYHRVEAYTPSITRLEIIKTNADKK